MGGSHDRYMDRYVAMAVLNNGSIAIFALLLMKIDAGEVLSPEHLNIINLGSFLTWVLILPCGLVWWL